MRIFMLLLVLCFGLIIPVCAEQATDKSAQTPPSAASPKPSDPGNPYTSVIIDTLGLKLDRCMSPKIRRVDGSEVWGTVKVDYDFLADHGIVAYVGTMDEAMKNPRCGLNPMIIKATGISGGNFKSDPVLSNEDATLLLAEDGKGGFFAKFNVIFVKDGKL